MGYEITAQDLGELLTGKRVTHDKKPLQRRDGSGFQAKLWLDDQYEIKLAPRTTQTLTDEKCPKCGAQLKIIKHKDKEFFGCSNYPKCAFSKNMEEEVPKSAPKPEPTPTDRPVLDLMGNLETGVALASPTIETIEPIDIPTTEITFDVDPLATEVPEPMEVSPEDAVEPAAEPPISLNQEPEVLAATVPDQKPKAAPNTGVYARIPDFIMEMLKLEPDELTGTKIETPVVEVQPSVAETVAASVELNPHPPIIKEAVISHKPVEEELLTMPLTQPENLELELLGIPKRRPTLT